MNDTPKKSPLVVKSTSRREVIIAVAVGLVLVGFIFFGISRLGKEATGGFLSGTITEKTFTPLPETRISIGKQGLNRQQVEGDYTFNVRVPDDRDYTVWVDRTVYDAMKVGDTFRFPRPSVSE